MVLFKKQNVSIKNSKIILGQQKTKINQYPLYKFYNCEGIPLEDSKAFCNNINNEYHNKICMISNHILISYVSLL